jgi:hypothetical protein
MYLDDKVLSEEQIKEKKKNNDNKRNPFDSRITKVFDTVQQYEIEKECKRYRSMNRTKQSIFTYARCEQWEYFITLTLDSVKVDRYNYTVCSKKVRVWLNNLRKISPNLKYLVVPEQHKDGAWHFHGVFACTGDIKFVDSGKVLHKDNSIIYNMPNYKYGFSTATKVQDVHKVAKYVGKYITKSVCDNTENKQRYYVSQNINKPNEMVLYLEENEEKEFIEMYADSVGKEVAYVSQTQAKENYTQCKYIELI